MEAYSSDITVFARDTYLMEHMSRPRNDDHLELALHLSDHQFFVEPVCPCED